MEPALMCISMAGQLREMSYRGATFVDLDGTLLTCNSMRIFMKRLPTVLLKRHAVGAFCSSLWWMAGRLLRMTSHKDMKWHLTKIARRHLIEEDWEKMAARMLEYVNPLVREYVDSPSREKCVKYIATAAMEEYALPLSRLLGYEGAVASRFVNEQSEYEEMRGLSKLYGIQALLNEKRLRPESFLTDHYDDIPTAREYPGLTILVNPTRKMQSIFHRVGVTRYLR